MDVQSFADAKTERRCTARVYMLSAPHPPADEPLRCCIWPGFPVPLPSEPPAENAPATADTDTVLHMLELASTRRVTASGVKISTTRRLSKIWRLLSWSRTDATMSAPAKQATACDEDLLKSMVWRVPYCCSKSWRKAPSIWNAGRWEWQPSSSIMHSNTE